MRKTLRIAKLIEDANDFLANSKDGDGMKQARLMMQVFVTNQLLDAKCYDGFRYINGWPCEDESRIAFYTNHKLRG